jgi:hypothetical protein
MRRSELQPLSQPAAARDFRWETPLAQTMPCGPDNEVVKGDPTLQVDPIAIDVVSRWILSETNVD